MGFSILPKDSLTCRPKELGIEPPTFRLEDDPPYLVTAAPNNLTRTFLGALMLVAWMLTGSVGTFIASFYKPDWPNKVLLGQKVWFQVDISTHTHTNNNSIQHHGIVIVCVRVCVCVCVCVCV